VFVVLAQPTENIWKGVHNGKVGRFLSRVVEVIADDEPVTSAAAATNTNTTTTTAALAVTATTTTTSATTSASVAAALTPTTPTSTTIPSINTTSAAAAAAAAATTSTTTASSKSPRAIVPALSLPVTTTELVKQKTLSPRVRVFVGDVCVLSYGVVLRCACTCSVTAREVQVVVDHNTRCCQPVDDDDNDDDDESVARLDECQVAERFRVRRGGARSSSSQTQGPTKERRQIGRRARPHVGAAAHVVAVEQHQRERVDEHVRRQGAW
jgi:hypothetical protein